MRTMRLVGSCLHCFLLILATVRVHATIHPVKATIKRANYVRVATEEVWRPNEKYGHLAIDLSGLSLSFDGQPESAEWTELIQAYHDIKHGKDRVHVSSAPSVVVGIAAFFVPSDSLICSDYAVNCDRRYEQQMSQHARCEKGEMVLGDGKDADSVVVTTVNVSTDLDTPPTRLSFAKDLPTPHTGNNTVTRDWLVDVMILHCQKLDFTYGEISATGSIELFYHNEEEDKNAKRRYLPPPLLQLFHWNCFFWVSYVCLIGKNSIGYFQWKRRQRSSSSDNDSNPSLSWVQYLILGSLVTRGLARSASTVRLLEWDTKGNYNLVLALSENLLDYASHVILGLFCFATLVNPLIAFSLDKWPVLRIAAIVFLGIYYSFGFWSSWGVSQSGLMYYYPDWYKAGNLFYVWAIVIILVQLLFMLWGNWRLPKMVKMLATFDSCPNLRRMVKRYLQVRQWFIAWLFVTLVHLILGGIWPIQTLQSWVHFQVVRELINLTFVLVLALKIHPMAPDDLLVGFHAFCVAPQEGTVDILWNPYAGEDDRGYENEDGIDVYEIGKRRDWKILYGKQVLRNIEVGLEMVNGETHQKQGDKNDKDSEFKALL